jgi:hypothetical protein
MTSRSWTILTLLLTLAGGGAFVLLNLRLDIYGLFRDAHGRRLAIYDSERRGKYLLNLRYVPSSFNAVLIGSSVSGNWDTSGIDVFRTYNESTDGGNITEEKVLVERALLTPGIEAAICVLHPYLTDTHGLNTAEMTDREYWGALGSITLLRSYKQLVATATGREKLVWGASGSEDVESPMTLNPVLQRLMAPERDFHVDEIAFAEYRALVSELRGRGVRLAAVVPPTLEELLLPRREAMDRYVSRMWTMFTPQDLLVDFNAPRYEAFRRERANFRDGVHLSRPGAAEVGRLLNQRLREPASSPAGRAPAARGTDPN